MGLKEKKAIAKINEQLKGKEKWVEGFLGEPLDYTTDYDSFGDDFLANSKMFTTSGFINRVQGVFFSALNHVCNNDMGKEAFLDAVESVAFENIEGEGNISLDDGVMAVKMPYTNTDAYIKETQYISMIEDCL